MHPQGPHTTSVDGLRQLQEALPGLPAANVPSASPALAFTNALRALHKATSNAGRFGLSEDAGYRLQLRRTIADMASALDATSTPSGGSRSFDAVLADLRSLETGALDRRERAVLLDALAPIQEQLHAATDIDVERILLDATPAGTDLADLVFDTDPSLLDPDAQLSYVQACERLANAVHARRDCGIATFVGANPVRTHYWVDGDERTLTDVRALELQAALRWGQGFTRTRIDTARGLVLLPETSTAFTQGRASQRTVDAIANGASTLTSPIDDALEACTRQQPTTEQTERLWLLRQQMLTEFDASVARFAIEHNPLHVQAKIRDTIVRLDPAGAAARRAIAIRAQANVEYRTLPDGLSQVIATLAAEQALACMRTIDTLARDADASEPIGLRRANAFTAMVTHSHPTHASGPAIATVAQTFAAAAEDAGEVAAGGARGRDLHDVPVEHSSGVETTTTPTRGLNIGVHLDVVMDLDTVLGLSNTAAEVVGAGPLPAHAVRALLADAAYVKLRRVVTDPVTGHRLDTGIRRYVLTEAEQARIFSRDRFCRFPDCTRPASRCECDHALPYDQGGPSSAANLGALCKAHHQHKTHAGWRITTSNADGSCEWTSPLGRTYAHATEPPLPWLIGEQQTLAAESTPPSPTPGAGPEDDQDRTVTADPTPPSPVFAAPTEHDDPPF